MSDSEEIITSDCRACKRRTRHSVIQELEEETDPESYHEKDTWQIIQCMGCLTTGFRHRNDDYEQVYEIGDGDVRHTVSIELYPRVLRNHQGLSFRHFIPPLIRKVYLQTLAAYGEQAYVLASIGLRANIEAVCNHLQISGNNLEKRIDLLFKGGYISNADKKRLHAIRFLGNDAAHDIKEPKEAELRVALEIIEHLINSVFILEKKATRLETVVESYPEFLRLINSCAGSAPSAQAISLGALLGAKRRLVSSNIDSFENQLKSDIQEGRVAKLSLAQNETVGGKEVQLYTLNVDETKPNDDSTDDLF
ncbi:hypothetical protein J2X54_004728 [Duganella sp. 3397]|uniref:DUF4145 domain-containing protein n=1 Tax=Duganella sp. 3397 TaxID=2817732 RepID=UPI002862E473|nr:DUF4145 domain-containing protein [Duganella sp. 3397]MDR7052224.1 hypothetical protein [Duganella sp. 3397]